MSQHKELKMAEKLCRDKRKLCHDTKFKFNIESQEDFVVTEKFLSQQSQLKVEENFVMTKTFIVATKVEKNYKKNVAT